MNDCVWCWVWACRAGVCKDCPFHLDGNSEEGRKINQQYENEVAEAIKPIKEKYKKQFRDMKMKRKKQ